MSAADAVVRPSTAQLMAWLDSVPDPEIPVLSLVDLGVIRDVRWEADTCVVMMTPTYSGCPAVHDMTAAVEAALQTQGVSRVDVRLQLAPAWTTDWLTERGRAALLGYGIAPPAEQAVDASALVRRRHGPDVPCPRCGSTRTRLLSQFGATACKALYQCSDCREPFDYFKAH